MLAANHFFARYLTRLYRIFDGDLLSAIVLAEIGHHSVSAFMMQEGGITGVHDAVKEGRLNRDAYLPTNAFSIAQVTGIPRETARRKLERLAADRYVERRPDGWVVSAERVEPELREFTRESVYRLLAVADEIMTALKDADLNRHRHRIRKGE